MPPDTPTQWTAHPDASGHVEDARPSPVALFPELHHYTTIEGLKGILHANAMWATSFTALNDSTELRWFRTYAEAFIEPHVDRQIRGLAPPPPMLDASIGAAGGLEPLIRNVAEGLVARLYDIYLDGKGPTGTRFEPFVVSFCSHGGDTDYEAENGLLSQWRGYGLAGGAAIVFDHAVLARWLKSETDRNSALIGSDAEVFYDRGAGLFARQFPTFTLALQAYASAWIEAAYVTGEVAEINRLAANLAQEFLVNAARFKHRAFMEEREVRFAFILHSDGHGPPQGESPSAPGVRLRGEGVRYIAVAGAGELTSAIKRIIVGPCRDQPALVREVQQLAGSEIPVHPSATPLVR